jgi:hypothetical protein
MVDEPQIEPTDEPRPGAEAATASADVGSAGLRPPVPSPSTAHGLPQVTKFLGSVVAPTTLLTALLFYFGWLHAYWFFRSLGVHSTVLDLSTRDYVQRSVDSLFVPIVVMAAVAVPALWGHARLHRRVRDEPPPHWLPALLAGLGTLGLVLTVSGLWRSVSAGKQLVILTGVLARVARLETIITVVGLVGLAVAATSVVYQTLPAYRQRTLGQQRHIAAAATAGAAAAAGSLAVRYAAWAALPAGDSRRSPAGATAMGLAIGVGLLVYVVHMHRAATAGRDGTVLPSLWTAVAEWAVVFSLVAVSLFWAAGDYSAAVGRERAAQLIRQLNDYPEAVIFSERSLSLTAPGVTQSLCDDAGSAYKVRYDGLRLIWQSGGQYLLLTPEWNSRTGSALLLPRSDTIRLEFLRPGVNISVTC